MLEPHFPLGASLATVLAGFAFFLVAFDIILVRRMKLGKVAWKRIEYLWLAFAALGLLAGVAQVRVITANAQVAMFQDRAASAFSSVRSLAQLLSSSPGTVCGTFIRSEFSPPRDAFDAIQKDYDRACEWFKAIVKAIPSEQPAPLTPINPSSLPRRPEASAAGLVDMIGGFFTQLGYYNRQAEILDDLLRKTRRTGVEDSLVYLGPFLLAIALALRITKVTGEIRLES